MYNAKTLDVQCKNTVRAFALLYIRKKSTNSMIEKKKKVHIEQTKSTLTFTHSPNNYHNISQNIYFSLWLVTVSYFIILF